MGKIVESLIAFDPIFFIIPRGDPWDILKIVKNLFQIFCQKIVYYQLLRAKVGIWSMVHPAVSLIPVFSETPCRKTCD